MRRDFKGLGLLSLSARRAWIEITYVILLPRAQVVALRKESVDRNGAVQIVIIVVDTVVALRKESVDRNYSPTRCWTPKTVSLSARRAWIEILPPAKKK